MATLGTLDQPTEPDPELIREIDAIEAERFRLEIERDARGDLADWPDGS